MIAKLFNRFLSFFKSSTSQTNNLKVFKKPRAQVSKDFITRKTQSMQDSQGVSDFSGSGYKGPGNVDNEKRHSNMSQRNF